MRVPVLIVGGGVTGLSTALFLAFHRVPCILVERHPDLLIHPRARGLTPRTMEVFRQAGLEQSIWEAAYADKGFTYTPISADTLDDEHYQPVEEPAEDDGSDATPTGFGPIDQDKLEILVRDRARELGADLRFDTELTAFGQDAGGVRATVRHRRTGKETRVEADYLVAADGWASPIRQRLGIAVDGPGPLFHTITAIVSADLTPAVRGRPMNIAYLRQPQPFTIIMAHDSEGSNWVFGTGYDPARESPADFTDERVAELVRAAAGLPDVQVTLLPQIPGTDLKVLGFPIVAQLARAYRAGRVFLAGDAARANPPTGGLGANTGIQDAHNLAWKLAAGAGSALLDTYEQERRPVGELTMNQALARFGSRMGSGGAELIDYGAVSLGYQYRSAAILGVPEDAAPVPPRLLSGTPGTRAPHAEVVHNGRRISTLDLYGDQFVLLTGAQAGDWSGIPVYAFGRDLLPAEAARAHGLGPEDAMLVRPDGFVAWRGSGDPRSLPDILDAALCR